MDKVKAKALTFDDVLLVPSYCDFLPSQASVKTSLTRNIDINLPLLSAAMDTVTAVSYTHLTLPTNREV